MKSALAYGLFALALLAGASACEEPLPTPGDAGSGGSLGSGGAPDVDVCEGGSELFITDPSNYVYTNTLTVEHKTLRDASNLTFDWSGVTTDFLGHAVDPSQDIDKLLITLWQLTPSEIADALRQDQLSLSYNAGALEKRADGTLTSTDLHSMTPIGGDAPDPEAFSAFFDTQIPGYQFPQDSHTFLLMAQTGTVVGKNARMLHTFNIDPNATDTELALSSTSTTLEFTVDLDLAQAVRMPVDTPNIDFDWSRMTTTSLGNEWDPLQINEVVVAHFPLTRAELEASFLDLRDIHDGWFSRTSIAGTSVNLSTLMSEGGAAFPGISSGGLWMVALFCTEDCNSPAPWSITFLEPCP